VFVCASFRYLFISQEHLEVAVSFQNWAKMGIQELISTSAKEDLVGKIREGKCILFLGAGVHAPPPESGNYSYPSEIRPLLGGELAKLLAENGKFQEVFPGEPKSDLQRVSLFYEITNGRNNLVKILERELCKNKKPSPTLSMIASLPFKIIVTTNFDQLLETALISHGKTPSVFIYDPDRSQDERTPDLEDDPTDKSPMVFKMHGDIQQYNTIVITDEDYIRFVQNMSQKPENHPVPETIRFRMAKWPTLFLGYSLHDYNLRLLFRTLRWKIDTASIPLSYSIDSNPDPIILKIYQDVERYICFVTEDIWKFVPWLYREINGKEFNQ
jgi:hypothetical protein